MPFGFTGTFETYDLNVEKYNKATHKAMVDTMIKGADAFVKAALPRIPIRTGFLAGAFRNLQLITRSKGEIERIGGKSLPKLTPKQKKSKHSNAFFEAIRAARLGPKKLRVATDLLGRAQKQGEPGIDKREYYYGVKPKVLKTPFSGRRFGTPENEIFNFDLSKSGITIKYQFKYEININYFFQDFTSGRSPTAPWGAMKAGEAAYIDYLRRNAKKRVPNIFRFLVRTRIKLDADGSVSKTVDANWFDVLHPETREVIK